MWLSTLITTLLITSAFGIFEDQAGKFDWRKQLVGCPQKVVFDENGRILLSTRQSMLASLKSTSGAIEWRRIMEPTSSPSSHLEFTHENDEIHSISEDGRSVRVWRKQDGVLVRQIVIGERISNRNQIHVANGHIFVATAHSLSSFGPRTDEPVQTINFDGKRDFSAFFHKNDEIFHVSGQKSSKNVEIVKIDSDGTFETGKKLEFDLSENCQTAENHLICFHGTTLTFFGISQKILKFNTNYVIKSVRTSGNDRILVIGGEKSEKITWIQVENDKLSTIRQFEAEISEVFGFVENRPQIVGISTKNVRIIGKSPEDDVIIEKLTESEPSEVYVSKEYEVLVIGKDCRVEMISLDVNTKQTVVEWSREESLINAVSVEMVDLPLSESQQMVEDEFEEGESNVISAFVRRIQVQFGQLCRFVTKSVEKTLFVFTSISKHGNGLSDFINSVRSASGDVFSDSSTPFERDYFNLRKVIIVVTSDGTIFGIDSSSGNILWKLWLGAHFSPLESVTDSFRAPLFVQRTTAHYQLDGLASVAFSDRNTKNGVIVSFNPMIGKLVSTQKLDYPIKRISLLPVANNKHVLPIMVTGKQNEIDIIPSISATELSSFTSLHLLDIDSKNQVSGLKVDLVKRTVQTVWTGNVGLTKNDQIVAVKGKPYHQKVHSQGRVLVTRDVQYKYVNPNLAAIASLDKSTQHLTIVLVDIVSGQVVHIASVGKAAGPVHVVHSEHWIAYSYWSEKGRRTELGVIELYEGAVEPPASDHVFDSRIPGKVAPVVVSQSYIYAQGVDAMSVSETEQGLTTRSILLAHPSGNIHEVSRRLLDATRPMELTQSMREEMMIGYMPEIAVATEEMINYNQTVHKVRGIKTFPSGLESTSLVLAYGTDLFFTRLTPSGTFDILKDDFDHVLIATVLVALVFGSYFTKRLARSNALAAQWA